MAHSDIWETHEDLLSPDDDTPEEFLIGSILESISFLPNSPLTPNNAPTIVLPNAPNTKSIHVTAPDETGKLVAGAKHLAHERGLFMDKEDKNISNKASKTASLPLYERLVKKRRHNTGPDIRFPNSRTVTITPMNSGTLPYRFMRTLAGYSTGGYGYSDGYAVGYPAGTGVYASAVPSGFQADPGKVKRYSNKYDDSKHASFGGK